MGKRYVPKTYNNRRLLRIILGTVITVSLAAVVIFLLLFFALENYWVDGRLEIPWLAEEMAPAD
jgi:hypothetical protein